MPCRTVAIVDGGLLGGDDLLGGVDLLVDDLIDVPVVDGDLLITCG